MCQPYIESATALSDILEQNDFIKNEKNVGLVSA